METTLALPTKEIQKTNKEVMGLQDSANALAIENPDDAKAAADLLESIKQAEKVITTRKEDITRPLMRSLASVRDLFKPIELTLTNAKSIVKAKMIAYQTIEDARIAEATAKINKRVEKGTMRLDTALEKLGDIGTGTKMKSRMVTKIRIMDETMIPREYLTPDMTKIAQAILKEGKEVLGVEKYQEKIIVS